MTDATKGALLGLIGVMIFGLTLPATRIAVAELPVVFVAFGRAVVAAALAGAVLWTGRAPRPSRAQIGRLAVVACGVIIGFPLFSALAMARVPAAHGGVVLGVLPLATAVAAMLFARERPSRRFWLWGMVGAAAVMSFALIDGGGGLHWADGLLVLAVASAAMGYAISGDLARSLGGGEVICWALVLCLPVILGPVVWVARSVDWGASWQAWVAFGYVAVFSQFLGFFFWNRGMALGGVAKVGQVQLLQIFFTLAGSALLLGEPIGWHTGVFALVVAGSVWAGRRALVVRR